jgi:hypothetical protein
MPMSFKKNKIFHLLFAGLLITLPTSIFAGAESGFYIGAGAGDASVEFTDFDESDSSYKFFGGYNIGFIPLVDFAIEASYVDFGSPRSGADSVDISGVNVFGLAGLSFGPFGVFAKVGMIDWDVDRSTTDSGTDPAYGLGVRVALGSFAVRAEYEIYDFDAIDVEMISVSGVYTF